MKEIKSFGKYFSFKISQVLRDHIHLYLVNTMYILFTWFELTNQVFTFKEKKYFKVDPQFDSNKNDKCHFYK